MLQRSGHSGFAVHIHFLLEAAARVVVVHLHDRAVLFGADQTVFAVPRIGPAVSGRQHVAVRIVSRLRRVHLRILVQQVADIAELRGAFLRRQAIADAVVGVRVGFGNIARALLRSGQLPFVVVAVIPVDARILHRCTLVAVVQRVVDFRNSVQSALNKESLFTSFQITALYRTFLRAVLIYFSKHHNRINGIYQHYHMVFLPDY